MAEGVARVGYMALLVRRQFCGDDD